MRPTFIPTIYHNVLRLLGMASASKSQWCEMPLACVLIPVYCDRIQAQYNLEGTARMDEPCVEEIKLYKQPKGKSKHEYLVAKVRAPDGTSFCLAFERGRGEAIDKATHEEGDNNTKAHPASTSNIDTPSNPEKRSFFKRFSKTSSSSTLTSLDSLFRRREADDKVTLLDSSKYKGEHVLFRTLSFDIAPGPLPSSSSHPLAASSSSVPPPIPSISSSVPPPIPSTSSSVPPPIPSTSSSALPPAASSSSPSPLRLPLYELAVLANTLHHMKPEYLLFSDNCYFYAGTIIKVLQERYNPAVVVETTGSKSVDEQHGLGRNRKGKEKERKAGTWHSIEIYAGEKIETAPLKEEFDKDLNVFKKPVQDHEDERKAKEAESKAQLKAKEVQLKAIEAENVRLKHQIQDMEAQKE